MELGIIANEAFVNLRKPSACPSEYPHTFAVAREIGVAIDGDQPVLMVTRGFLSEILLSPIAVDAPLDHPDLVFQPLGTGLAPLTGSRSYVRVGPKCL